MNNLQKIVVLGLGLAVLGALIWFASQDRGLDDKEALTNNSSDQLAEEDILDNNELSGFGSFATLLGLGQNISCEFSFTDETGSGSGTGYFAGDRMRIDSVVTSEGQTYDSHMINDGSYMYTWAISGDGEFAVKMPVPEEDGSSIEDAYDLPETEESGYVSTDQSVDYDCDRWSVDSSVFVPPSDVEFMDMGEMMNQMMESLPEGFEMPEGMPMMQ